jgi:hypothetical protein
MIFEESSQGLIATILAILFGISILVLIGWAESNNKIKQKQSMKECMVVTQNNWSYCLKDIYNINYDNNK